MNPCDGGICYFENLIAIRVSTEDVLLFCISRLSILYFLLSPIRLRSRDVFKSAGNVLIHPQSGDIAA